MPHNNETTSTSTTSNQNGGEKRQMVMPAEWERHEACLILYPHNSSTFRVELARRQVEQVAQAIARHGKERVVLYCHSEQDLGELQKRIREDCDNNDDGSKHIEVSVCVSNDTWARDTAPTFVIAQEIKDLIGLNWDFNAYGGPHEGCYWPCDLDCLVAPTLCRQLSLKCQSVPVVLEGGAIHTDGQGTILTTEECLLNQNRNPNLTKEQLEHVLCSKLGASKVIWLPCGVAYDVDTDGHVDNWACFVRPGHIVLAWTDDNENDQENYQRCRQALELLSNTTDAQGRALVIHKLYLPTPIYYTQQDVESLQPMMQQQEDGTTSTVPPRIVGERMAASYVNFYIANEAVVIPQFGDDMYDKKAIKKLAGLFPDRSVVGVDSREILIGGGNIHCITQQLPKLVV